MDPCLCTHILYSFVPIGPTGLLPSAYDYNLFVKMTEWKTRNPTLKILISVGGWTEGSTNFNSIVLTDQSRQSFCSQVVRVAREYNLDGFDIDWYLILILDFFLFLDLLII